MRLNNRLRRLGASVGLATAAAIGVTTGIAGAAVAGPPVGAGPVYQNQYTTSYRLCTSLKADYISQGWKVTVNCRNINTAASPYYWLQVGKVVAAR